MEIKTLSRFVKPIFIIINAILLIVYQKEEMQTFEMT